jgi:hypothetical protein
MVRSLLRYPYHAVWVPRYKYLPRYQYRTYLPRYRYWYWKVVKSRHIWNAILISFYLCFYNIKKLYYREHD